MMGYGAGMGWGWMFGALMMIGVVLLVVLAVRAIGGGVSRPGRGSNDGAPSGPGRARELLDERYARGELTTEEYQERLRVLGDNG